jgi:hypothetical protein
MDKELLIKIFFLGGGEGWGCSLDPIFELEPIQKTHAQYTKRTHGTYLVSCISLLLYHQSNLPVFNLHEIFLYYSRPLVNLFPCAAFEKLLRFIYSGDKSIVSAVKELDLLFEMFRLADEVNLVLISHTSFFQVQEVKYNSVYCQEWWM